MDEECERLKMVVHDFILSIHGGCIDGLMGDTQFMKDRLEEISWYMGEDAKKNIRENAPFWKRLRDGTFKREYKERKNRPPEERFGEWR